MPNGIDKLYKELKEYENADGKIVDLIPKHKSIEDWNSAMSDRTFRQKLHGYLSANGLLPKEAESFFQFEKDIVGEVSAPTKNKVSGDYAFSEPKPKAKEQRYTGSPLTAQEASKRDVFGRGVLPEEPLASEMPREHEQDTYQGPLTKKGREQKALEELVAPDTTQYLSAYDDIHGTSLDELQKKKKQLQSDLEKGRYSTSTLGGLDMSGSGLMKKTDIEKEIKRIDEYSISMTNPDNYRVIDGDSYIKGEMNRGGNANVAYEGARVKVEKNLNALRNGTYQLNAEISGRLGLPADQDMVDLFNMISEAEVSDQGADPMYLEVKKRLMQDPKFEKLVKMREKYDSQKSSYESDFKIEKNISDANLSALAAKDALDKAGKYGKTDMVGDMFVNTMAKMGDAIRIVGNSVQDAMVDLTGYMIPYGLDAQVYNYLVETGQTEAARKFKLELYQEQKVRDAFSKKEYQLPSAYTQSIFEKTANVNGINLIIDEKGEVIGARDKNNYLIPGDDKKVQAAVSEYNKAPNKYQASVFNNLSGKGKSALATTSQIIMDMLPILGTSAISGGTTLGVAIGSASTMFPSIYKQAIESGEFESALGATTYAMGMASAMAFVEAKVGKLEAKFGKALNKDSYLADFGELAKRMAKGELTPEQFSKEGIKAFWKRAGEEVPSEILEELSSETLNQTGNLAVGLQESYNPEAFAEAIIYTPMATLPIGSVTAAINGNAFRKDLQQAAKQPNKFFKTVDKLVANGDITQEQGNETKQFFKKSREDEYKANGADEKTLPIFRNLLLDLEIEKKRLGQSKTELSKKRTQARIDELTKKVEDLEGKLDRSELNKNSFSDVPVSVSSREDGKAAELKVFEIANTLQIGQVITNSDGDIKIVTDKNVGKNGNITVVITTFERRDDGSLLQVSDPLIITKNGTQYNPHYTSTNASGERVTVTDEITNDIIDLSKEVVFVSDKNGDIVQTSAFSNVKANTTESENLRKVSETATDRKKSNLAPNQAVTKDGVVYTKQPNGNWISETGKKAIAPNLVNFLDLQLSNKGAAKTEPAKAETKITETAEVAPKSVPKKKEKEQPSEVKIFQQGYTYKKGSKGKWVNEKTNRQVTNRGITFVLNEKAKLQEAASQYKKPEGQEAPKDGDYVFSESKSAGLVPYVFKGGRWNFINDNGELQSQSETKSRSLTEEWKGIEAFPISTQSGIKESVVVENVTEEVQKKDGSGAVPADSEVLTKEETDKINTILDEQESDTKRLPQGPGTKGNGLLGKAAAFIRRAGLASNKESKKWGEVEADTRKREDVGLKAFANKFLGGVKKILDFTTDSTPLRSGAEARVYKSKDNRFVIKVNTGDLNDTRASLLRRLELHEELFPSTAYELIGVVDDAGLSKDKTGYVLRQKFYDGDAATESEITSDLEMRGFTRVDTKTDQGGVFKNEQGIYITDVFKKNGEPPNVIKSTEGHLFYIDPIIYTDEAIFNKGGNKEQPNKNVRTVSFNIENEGKLKLIRNTPAFKNIFSEAQFKELKVGDNVVQLNMTAWGKAERMLDAKDITNVEPQTKKDDKENKKRVSGKEQVREEPVKTEPNKEGIGKETEAGGIFQAQEKVEKSPEQDMDDILSGIQFSTDGEPGLEDVDIIEDSGLEVKSSFSAVLANAIKDFVSAGETGKSRAITALKQLMPSLKKAGIKVVVHQGSRSMLAAQKKRSTAENQATKGFYDPATKELHINLEKLGEDTPIHEFLHPIISALAKANPAALQSLVEQVRNDKDLGVEIDQFVEENYKNSKGVKDEEKVVTFLGVKVAEILEQKKLGDNTNEPLLKKIVRIFKQFLQDLGIPLNTWKILGDINDRTPILGLAENLAEAIASGRNISFIGRTSKIEYTPTVRSSVNSLINYISRVLPQFKNIKVVSELRKSVDGFLDINAKTNLYKKAFGERTARLIRSKMPIAFDRHIELIEYLKNKVPVKSHLPYIIENMGGQLEEMFLSEGTSKKENKSNQVSVKDLLSDVGYDISKIRSEEDANLFRVFYEGEGSNNEIGGSIICTYRDVPGRLRDNFVMFITKNDAKETLRAESLTQENLSESWKKYLESKGRKNEDGTYNLSGLKNHREDPFSTSVLSIQINKQNGYLKVISRYNHTIHSGNTNPDATFDNDLSKIVNGLEEALYREVGAPSRKDKSVNILPEGVVKDSEGRLFNFAKEVNGVYYGEGFYIKNGESILLDPNTERIVDGFVVRSNGGITKIASTIGFPFGEVLSVKFLSGNKISMSTKDYGDIEFETKNGLIQQGVKMNEELRLNGLRNIATVYSLGEDNVEIALNIPNYKELLHIFWSDKIQRIREDADFSNSQVTSLGNLQSIGGIANFSNSQVTSLGNLQSIGGSAYFSNSQVTSLGNLQSIGGNANFSGSQVTSLGNLQSIGVTAYFSDSQVTSLGNLQSIGGTADFRNSQVTSLGNLQSIGGTADFRNSQVTSLGNLQSIGGIAYFSNSQVTSLGNLQSIGGTAYFINSQVTSLGNLQSIGGNAYFNIDSKNAKLISTIKTNDIDAKILSSAIHKRVLDEIEKNRNSVKIVFDENAVTIDEKIQFQKDNKIKTNEKGRVISKRLRPEEEQGRDASGELNAEASTILERLHKAVKGKYGEGSNQAIRISKEEERELENYSRQIGVWTENADKQFGTYVENGQEQAVYINPDNTSVVTKLNTGSLEANWLSFLDRIALHNANFPATAYKLKGFGRESDGTFVAILEQPFIQGTEADVESIKSYMQQRGFEPLSNYDDSIIGTVEEDRAFINKDTGVIVEDLHLNNVIKDDKGNVFIIDPIIHLDTEDKGYGGDRKPNEESDIRFSKEGIQARIDKVVETAFTNFIYKRGADGTLETAKAMANSVYKFIEASGEVTLTKGQKDKILDTAKNKNKYVDPAIKDSFDKAEGSFEKTNNSTVDKIVEGFHPESPNLYKKSPWAQKVLRGIELQGQVSTFQILTNFEKNGALTEDEYFAMVVALHHTSQALDGLELEQKMSVGNITEETKKRIEALQENLYKIATAIETTRSKSGSILGSGSAYLYILSVRSAEQIYNDLNEKSGNTLQDNKELDRIKKDIENLVELTKQLREDIKTKEEKIAAQEEIIKANSAKKTADEIKARAARVKSVRTKADLISFAKQQVESGLLKSKEGAEKEPTEKEKANSRVAFILNAVRVAIGSIENTGDFDALSKEVNKLIDEVNESAGTSIKRVNAKEVIDALAFKDTKSIDETKKNVTKKLNDLRNTARKIQELNNLMQGIVDKKEKSNVRQSDVIKLVNKIRSEARKNNTDHEVLKEIDNLITNVHNLYNEYINGGLDISKVKQAITALREFTEKPTKKTKTSEQKQTELNKKMENLEAAEKALDEYGDKVEKAKKKNSEITIDPAEILNILQQHGIGIKKVQTEYDKKVEADIKRVQQRRLKLTRLAQRAVEESEKSQWSKAGGALKDALVNFVRTLVVTIDMSAPLTKGGLLGQELLIQRRGDVLIDAYKNALNAMVDGYKGSERVALDFYDDLQRNGGAIYEYLYGLKLDHPYDPELTDEYFQSSIATFLGKFLSDANLNFFQGSEAHMVTYMNHIRFAAFDAFYKLNPEATKEELEAYAEFINNLSGTTKKPISNAVFNSAFLAFKYMMSRFYTIWSGINPNTYIRASKGDIAAIQQLKGLRNIIVSFASAMTLMALVLGDDAYWDIHPYSSEFLKLVVGDSSYDFTFGIGAILRMAFSVIGQLNMAFAPNTLSELHRARFESMSKTWGNMAALSPIVKFGREKLNPIFGAITAFVSKEDYVGKPYKPSSMQPLNLNWYLLADNFTPLFTGNLFGDVIFPKDTPSMIERLSQLSLAAHGGSYVNFQNEISQARVKTLLKELDISINKKLRLKDGDVLKAHPYFTWVWKDEVKNLIGTELMLRLTKGKKLMKSDVDSITKNAVNSSELRGNVVKKLQAMDKQGFDQVVAKWKAEGASKNKGD